MKARWALMTRALLLCTLLPCALFGAVNAQEVTQVQRRAVLEFVFDPEKGSMKVMSLERTGQKPFVLERLSVHALGDRIERGRRIGSEVTRTGGSSFDVQLGLDEGLTWNVVFDAVASGEVLTGSHLLSVGKSLVQGRLALVRPPTAEVSKLSWLAASLFVVPVALTGLIVILAVLQKHRLAEQEP